MATLTYQAYQELKALAAPHANKTKREAWYAVSYEIFSSQELYTMADFWKIVAFTYSWMPTIPKIYIDELKDPDWVLAELKKLKAGETIDRNALLQALIPVINNSLVGTSKVLHFIAPTRVPIIDSRVQRAWNKFFFNELQPDSSIVRLPSDKISLETKHIKHYLQYWDNVSSWIQDCNQCESTSMRDLEWCLYLYGNRN